MSFTIMLNAIILQKDLMNNNMRKTTEIENEENQYTKIGSIFAYRNNDEDNNFNEDLRI